MEKEIQRTLDKLVEMKWITINDNLVPEAVTTAFMKILTDMKLSDFVDIFKPKDF